MNPETSAAQPPKTDKTGQPCPTGLLQPQMLLPAGSVVQQSTVLIPNADGSLNPALMPNVMNLAGTMGCQLLPGNRPVQPVIYSQQPATSGAFVYRAVATANGNSSSKVAYLGPQQVNPPGISSVINSGQKRPVIYMYNKEGILVAKDDTPAQTMQYQPVISSQTHSVGSTAGSQFALLNGQSLTNQKVFRLVGNIPTHNGVSTTTTNNSGVATSKLSGTGPFKVTFLTSAAGKGFQTQTDINKKALAQYFPTASMPSYEQYALSTSNIKPSNIALSQNVGTCMPSFRMSQATSTSTATSNISSKQSIHKPVVVSQYKAGTSGLLDYLSNVRINKKQINSLHVPGSDSIRTDTVSPQHVKTVDFSTMKNMLSTANKPLNTNELSKGGSSSQVTASSAERPSACIRPNTHLLTTDSAILGDEQAGTIQLVRTIVPSDSDSSEREAVCNVDDQYQIVANVFSDTDSSDDENYSPDIESVTNDECPEDMLVDVDKADNRSAVSLQKEGNTSTDGEDMSDLDEDCASEASASTCTCSSVSDELLDMECQSADNDSEHDFSRHSTPVVENTQSSNTPQSNMTISMQKIIQETEGAEIQCNLKAVKEQLESAKNIAEDENDDDDVIYIPPAPIEVVTIDSDSDDEVTEKSSSERNMVPKSEPGNPKNTDTSTIKSCISYVNTWPAAQPITVSSSITSTVTSMSTHTSSMSSITQLATGTAARSLSVNSSLNHSGLPSTVLTSTCSSSSILPNVSRTAALSQIACVGGSYFTVVQSSKGVNSLVPVDEHESVLMPVCQKHTPYYLKQSNAKQQSFPTPPIRNVSPILYVAPGNSVAIQPAINSLLMERPTVSQPSNIALLSPVVSTSATQPTPFQFVSSVKSNVSQNVELSLATATATTEAAATETSTQTTFSSPLVTVPPIFTSVLTAPTIHLLTYLKQTNVKAVAEPSYSMRRQPGYDGAFHQFVGHAATPPSKAISKQRKPRKRKVLSGDGDSDIEEFNIGETTTGERIIPVRPEFTYSMKPSSNKTGRRILASALTADPDTDDNDSDEKVIMKSRKKCSADKSCYVVMRQIDSDLDQGQACEAQIENCSLSCRKKIFEKSL